MTKLSVNINKIAVIRNSRGGNVPDVLKVAQDCERFGAEGITVHPRPDERHIRYADVRALKSLVKTEFNIEGYPTPSFIDLVKEVQPHQVTLVPDPPDALTSNAGWNTVLHELFLRDIINEFKPLGIRVSVFVGTDLKHIEFAGKLGADRIELYTEPYAELYLKDRQTAVNDFVVAGKFAKKNGLGLNAGHDLSLINLKYLIQCLPEIDEVSIGHALIADALYYGLENTIQMYKQQLLLL
jgi:pyridoxine 5-phosphate synthase